MATTQRVCAAIIRANTILMVYHKDEERSYWTLPGGGVEVGETPEAAVVREVKEETGLDGRVVRFLFEESYLNGAGSCLCFLLAVEAWQEIALGYDPEEAQLPLTTRLLQDVAWHTLDSKEDDRQVAQVIRCLKKL